MNQQEDEFRFIALWFALESMVIENIQTDHKKRKLLNRLSKLYLLHNDSEIDRNNIEELWGLRTQIVHEARIGILGETSSISARHVNLTRYFYYLTTLLMLDTITDATELSQVWANISDYEPSITIGYESMPEFVNFTNLFRFTQEG